MIEISTLSFFVVYIYVFIAVGVIHEFGHLGVARMYDKNARMNGFKTTFFYTSSEQLRKITAGGVVLGLFALIFVNEHLGLSVEFHLLSIFWYFYFCKKDLGVLIKGK